MRHVRKGYANALRVDDGTGLVISRPDLQPDLTPVVERGVVPVSYLNSYVADDEQPCAFCAKRTPHKRGYTVSLADGRIALCGHCCADRFFGKEKAAALSSDYLQRHRLAMLRQAVANLQAAIPTLLDMFTPALVQFEKAALRAVKMISHETSRFSLRHRDIPGITALLSGGAPARIAYGRERLAGWMKIDAQAASGKDLVAVMREAAKVDAQLEIGLRFLSQAATLFDPANFSQVNVFCRCQSGAVDVFSMSRDLDGQLTLHRHPRRHPEPWMPDPKPEAHRIGFIPDIPEWLGLSAYSPGIADELQQLADERAIARKTKDRKRK